MMKRTIIFFFISFFVSFRLQAQIAVTGHVVDDEGQSLPSVIIKRLDTGHKMRGYARSGGDGAFSIKAEAGDTLEFSLLGFENVKVAVKEAMKPFTVKMRSSSIELKEVTVKSDKVHERGDTVSYIVGAYANGNDRSIGDVIAKMPGFDVDKKTGQISYEGRPISKFYIEGLDMLGGKYGTATNTLPQSEVGSVQVMRRHQPIRVLEDFTFTDDAAVNIKMKNSAKSHWVMTFKAGGGYGDHHEGYDKALWKFEGFGLRLKSDFQTMLTYKTNNTGEDVSRESTNLFSFAELTRLQPKDFIVLSAPSARVSANRSLMNRSHAVTANAMKRVNEDSQWNLQLVYNNERDKAWGGRRTEYVRTNGNLIIDNDKAWHETENDLYALLKYEHNSKQSYLRNSLSGDFKWLSQHLDETGLTNHFQKSRLPVYDFRDDLYVIRRFGNKLISFYSNNNIQSRPQHLYVDTLAHSAAANVRQDVVQHFYSTDTYASGGWKLGKLSLSMKLGVNGVLRHINANASGLSLEQTDSLSDKSHFGYVRLYATPHLEWATSDLRFSLDVPFSNTYYKYSEDDGTDRFDVSPSLHLRWYVTSHLSMSVRGSYDVEPIDFNRFYGSLIMQDYLYLNRGYRGYDSRTSKSLTYSFTYRNSLQGTHLMGSVTRSFDTDPYTTSREFVGDYIILGTEPMETKSDSWNATLMFQQGLSFLSGKFTLRGLYTHSNSKMLQDGALYPSKYNMLSTTASLYLSPYKDMSLNYSVRYGYNDMRPSSGSRTSFNSWQHEGSIIVPVGKFRLQLKGEYSHNQIATDQYKDAFFADVVCGYRFKHFDLDVNLNNLLNKKTYSYAFVSDLMTASSTTYLRGRECLLTLTYRP
ncbi:MAG: hypothetical protein ACOYJG_10960 [Prevotella sp.]|jgi:hypothetical protein